MQIRDTVNVFQCSDMQGANFARMYGVRGWAEYLDIRDRNNHLRTLTSLHNSRLCRLCLPLRFS
jgi:uncharacterized membrane protein